MAAILLLGFLVLPQASVATADDGNTDTGEIVGPLPSLELDPDTEPVEEPSYTPPYTPPTAPVDPTPVDKPAPKPDPAVTAPVVKPAPVVPAPVIEPAPANPAAEPEIVQEPVEETAEEIPVEAATTTAAPTTAAPTTVLGTTSPTVGSPSNTEQALPIESSSSNTPAPSNSLLLQLLVIGLLLAIGLWYLRFMKRGGKHLGVDSTGPVN